MNYFSPELLQRFGSDDDRVADAAQAEWEQAADTYRHPLRQIDPLMPDRLRELLTRFYFHHARVLFVGTSDRDLRLGLQLDPPPHDAVFLHCHLVEEPQLIQHPVDLGERSPELVWLYDEVQMQNEGWRPTFRQSILFNNSTEMVLVFDRIDFATARPLPALSPSRDLPSDACVRS